MTLEGKDSIVEQTDDMTEEHYPALFRSSDAASMKAQRMYLWLQRVHLGFL